VPQVNTILFVGTLLFSLTFKNSENLAHAYGFAINMYMILVDTMVAYTAIAIWNWSFFRVVPVFWNVFIHRLWLSRCEFA